MNYTLIGFIEGSFFYDQYGDAAAEYGKLEILTFRDDLEAFIAAWAKMSFNDDYNEIKALFNGISYDDLTNEEAEKYNAEVAFDQMQAAILTLKLAREQEKAAERERLALAAEAKAKELARIQRANDLAQFEALKKKLGM